MEVSDETKLKIIIGFIILSLLVYFSGELILLAANANFYIMYYMYSNDTNDTNDLKEEIKVEETPAPSEIEKTNPYDDKILYKSISGGITQHMVNNKNSYPHKNPLMYKLKNKVLLNNLEPIKHYSDDKLIL